MRRCIPIVSASLLAAMVACGDPYAHSNPYDPAAPVEITVSGPDTLFSYGELGHFSARLSPEFPDTAVQFGVSDSLSFFPAGPATFESLTPPLFPETKTVNVMAMVGQIDTRITSTDLTCCSPPAAVTVWVDGFDALGQLPVGLNGANANPPISASAPPLATLAVRDTSLALVTPTGVRASTLVARRPGATWIVATRGPLQDSLALVVR